MGPPQIPPMTIQPLAKSPPRPQNPHTGTKTRPQADPKHGELLILRIKHIRHHTQRDGTPRRTKTPEQPGKQNLPPGIAQRRKNLPAVDREQGQLHNRLAAKLLGPRRPQLAAKPIQDQEPCHACPGIGEVVTAQVVLLVQSTDRTRVDCGIVVYVFVR
ncbi:hypothetical protein J1614_007700 [Plenodomus biglobosus]|nr:hypothetical protein J1614_007700 [Plenodomus biglobosus]